MIDNIEYLSSLSEAEGRNGSLRPRAGNISGTLFDDLREIPTFFYNIANGKVYTEIVPDYTKPLCRPLFVGKSTWRV